MLLETRQALISLQKNPGQLIAIEAIRLTFLAAILGDVQVTKSTQPSGSTGSVGRKAPSEDESRNVDKHKSRGAVRATSCLGLCGKAYAICLKLC